MILNIIFYFDSLSWDGSKYMKTTERWLKDELYYKSLINPVKADCSRWQKWKHIQRTGEPQQSGGIDCGLFLLRYADCLSMRYGGTGGLFVPVDKQFFDFKYTQEDMNKFRTKVGTDIVLCTMEAT